jgi:hypothetical protein
MLPAGDPWVARRQVPVGDVNPNHAELLRITVREPERLTRDGEGPPAYRFDVVVEGRAGSVLAASSQPYTLSVSAFDFTAGANPHSAENAFTQKRVERFDAAHGWPDKVATFTVVVNDPDLVDGHLVKCFATLVSPNQINSFVEGPLVLLHLEPPPPRWSGRGPMPQL